MSLQDENISNNRYVLQWVLKWHFISIWWVQRLLSLSQTPTGCSLFFFFPVNLTVWSLYMRLNLPPSWTVCFWPRIVGRRNLANCSGCLLFGWTVKGSVKKGRFPVLYFSSRVKTYLTGHAKEAFTSAIAISKWPRTRKAANLLLMRDYTYICIYIDICIHFNVFPDNSHFFVHSRFLWNLSWWGKE